MLTLDDSIVDLKRTNQYGDESITSDAPTLDLIRWINKYRKAVAQLTAWSWLVKQFTLTLTANAQDIDLDSTIDKVIAVDNGRGGYLNKVSIKQALLWHTPVTGVQDTTELQAFANMGINATTGVKIVRVYGTPTSSGSLTAYGLKKFDPFTLASIGTSANFLPFPDEIMDLVLDLVSTRIDKFKGDKNWSMYEKVAWDSLRVMMGQEESDPSDDVTNPLPEYYKRRRAMRRGGMVA
jgi:hypothetical protein